MITRKQKFRTYLVDRPGERFSVKQIAEALGVNQHSMAVETLTWLNSPEFAEIGRAGSGLPEDPWVYWYEAGLQRPAEYPTRNGPSKARPKNKKRKPGRPPVRVAAKVDTDPAPARKTTEVYAVVLREEDGVVYLLDDRDRIIRGTFGSF